MDVATFHGLWTAALLVIFIGIVVWAWSGKRKRDFDAAARMALEDDDKLQAGSGTERNYHG